MEPEQIELERVLVLWPKIELAWRRKKTRGLRRGIEFVVWFALLVAGIRQAL